MPCLSTSWAKPIRGGECNGQRRARLQKGAFCGLLATNTVPRPGPFRCPRGSRGNEQLSDPGGHPLELSAPGLSRRSADDFELAGGVAAVASVGVAVIALFTVVGLLHV